MSDDDATDEVKALYRNVLESVGEGDLADRQALAVSEAFRLKNKLAASVAKTPQTYQSAYTLRDIERLQDMSREDWRVAQKKWREWHRKYVALGGIGLVAWITGATLTWICWFRAETTAAWINMALTLGISAFPLKVIGAIIGLGGLAMSPRFVATLIASDHWDGYSAGYGEGLRAGVNRALQITPERERQIWDHLHEADLAESHLERQGGRAKDQSN
jgi:hypothetical protein